MTELEKIAYAKSFIDKLANGINPLDDMPIPDDDITNNIRLSRCFFYVSSILQKEIDRERKKAPKEKKSELLPFSITQEQLKDFGYSPNPLSATAVARKINWLVRDDIEQKKIESLSYRKITQWLLNIGMIEYREWENGKMKRFPTEEGEKIGLVLADWDNYGRRTPVIYYTEDAQRFIIDNIDAVIATEIQKGKTSYPWGINDEKSCAVTEKDSPKESLRTPQIQFAQDPPAEPEAEEKLCRNCRFQLSGECSSWEPCDDFQPIYRISQTEIDNWPTEGDATRFKQKWKKNDWLKNRSE